MESFWSRPISILGAMAAQAQNQPTNTTICKHRHTTIVTWRKACPEKKEEVYMRFCAVLTLRSLQDDIFVMKNMLHAL
jgi:hypothetical protein